MEFNLQHLCYYTFQKAYTSITYGLSHDKSTYGQVSISQSFKIATKTADISLVIISKTNGTFQTTSLYNPLLSPLSQSPKTLSHFQKTKKKQNQNPQHQIVPSVTFSVTFEGKKKNVSWTRKMQQNPPHCEAPPNAETVAQQGTAFSQSHTVRCAGGTRGGLRGQQLQEIRGACDAPEPSHLQKAPGPS